MPPPKVDDPRWNTSNLSRWFAEEVHPHEHSLRAYLHGSFPAVRDVDDVVQESFLRAWRARAAQPVRSAKAFLFRIARNLALDRVRREIGSPIQSVRDLETLPVLDHGGSPVQAAALQEKLMMLADAIEALPPRCREVVILRKLQDLPQRAVAERLGLAEKTVEAQLARGIARCEVYLRRRGVRGWYDHD
jgi:RNA polymerase sigma factor (sigma-70 family)